MTPILGKPFILYISTTYIALGALLAQNNEQGRERAIYYINRKLVGYELNYSLIEWACLAIVFASQNLRHYMLRQKKMLISKIDPLKYLLSRAALTGCLAKWVMILSEFDIEYVDQKAIKGQVIADQSAEAPILDDHPMLIDFLDEAIFNIDIANEWNLYFEGSHTRNGSGVGIMFITPQGDIIPKSYRIAFHCTNNIVEYEALITGLKITIQWNIQYFQMFGDSQLVIHQVNNHYETKDDKLMPYKQMVDFLKSKFVTISFRQLPWIHNKQADAMATIASMIDMPQNVEHCEFLVEQLLIPAFELPQAEFVCKLVGPNSS